MRLIFDHTYFYDRPAVFNVSCGGLRCPAVFRPTLGVGRYATDTGVETMLRCSILTLKDVCGLVYGSSPFYTTGLYNNKKKSQNVRLQKP